MSLSFTPIQASALPALQALWNAQLAPHPADSLAQELQDGARAQGRQSVIAWRAGVPVGCAGWVTLGVANDGCAYGSPLVAADADAAFGLTGYIREQVAGHGADRLRITVRAGERAKADALRVAGFVPLFEFVNFNHPLPIKGPLGLPAGLHSVSPSLIDWNALLALDLLTFSGVPNAPPPDIGGLQDEWAAADPEARRSGCIPTGAGAGWRRPCPGSRRPPCWRAARAA